MWGTAICQLWLVKFLTPGLVVLAAGFALLTVAVLCREAEPLARARQFLKLPRLQQALVVFAVCILTVCAQKSGSNVVFNAEIAENGRRGEESSVGRDVFGTPLAQGSSATSNISVLRVKTSLTSLPTNPCQFVKSVALTTNDLTRGYAFVEARTNATVSYAMPTNGVEIGTWNKTGAYEDVARVKSAAEDSSAENGDLRTETRSSSQTSENSNASVLRAKKAGAAVAFPQGDVCITSLWVYTWGKVRPRLRDKAHEIVAVGTPMSCVPGEGRLWTAATTNDSWLITWENFRAGREIFNAENEESQRRGEEVATQISEDSSASPSLLNLRVNKNISAQIEFFANGDFITRSNNVERVYRRVNPDDWDDDGLANEIDEDPYHATCAFPFEIVGQSSAAIEVSRPSDRAADICWPVKISGRSLPFSRTLGANETFSTRIVYEGRPGSGVQPKVTAKFVSNDSKDSDLASSAELTVAQVEVLVYVKADENSSAYRHKFGICEELFLNFYPSGSGIQWIVSSGSDVDVKGRYKCPTYATTNPVKAVCGDAEFTPSIEVVEPSGIEARNPECETYGVSAGRAGWIGLKQEFYILPLDVSFGGIQMEEVPSSVGQRTGYFAHSSFSSIGCHAETMGAGVWNGVSRENRMGDHDIACLTAELLRVDANGDFTEDTSCGWADGWIMWAVPFGWTSNLSARYHADAEPEKTFDPGANQRFTITPTGSVTVEKFGNAARRDIDGKVFCNGTER